MARTIDATDYFTIGSAVLNPNFPITVNCWFKATDVLNAVRLVCINNTSSDVNRILLVANGAVSGDPVRWALVDNLSRVAIADTSSGFTAGQWEMATGCTTNENNHAAFLNGGSKVTDTQFIDLPLPGLNITEVGHEGRLTPVSSDQAADVAEIVIWNIALSDAEIADLYGAGPFAYGALATRPEAIVSYWRCLEDGSGVNLIDSFGNSHMSGVSSPAVAIHVPVLDWMPRRRSIGAISELVSSSSSSSQSAVSSSSSSSVSSVSSSSSSSVSSVSSSSSSSLSSVSSVSSSSVSSVSSSSSSSPSSVSSSSSSSVSSISSSSVSSVSSLSSSSVSSVSSSSSQSAVSSASSASSVSSSSSSSVSSVSSVSSSSVSSVSSSSSSSVSSASSSSQSSSSSSSSSVSSASSLSSSSLSSSSISSSSSAVVPFKRVGLQWAEGQVIFPGFKEGQIVSPGFKK